MSMRIDPFLYSIIALISFAGSAAADPVVRYACNTVGTAAPEPVGDRDGHTIVANQFTCVGMGGLLKGANYTAVNITEFDGPKGKYLLAGGVHRGQGGLVVTQALEGVTIFNMKDGKPVSFEGTGKAIVKFASGPFAQLSGKTLNLTVKQTGLNRWDLEFFE
ncbi:hypothetical protein XH98_14090 [Bradyrhizobium sp. CCBAU 51745]|uniref:hypothetical protein n=1 Tax=Bradyrhizobium sp. CCBAU 51745 TaxID=1325099 RepID=UPI00230689DD|nr:hypothetical protein [Bradyrhizobium sp. CCBAU 51745]MDA9440229.1 hypothetical protein [Bradyrhizobium sp. CCBAU 51745]